MSVFYNTTTGGLVLCCCNSTDPCALPVTCSHCESGTDGLCPIQIQIDGLQNGGSTHPCIQEAVTILGNSLSFYPTASSCIYAIDDELPNCGGSITGTVIISNGSIDFSIQIKSTEGQILASATFATTCGSTIECDRRYDLDLITSSSATSTFGPYADWGGASASFNNTEPSPLNSCSDCSEYVLTTPQSRTSPNATSSYNYNLIQGAIGPRWNTSITSGNLRISVLSQVNLNTGVAPIGTLTTNNSNGTATYIPHSSGVEAGHIIQQQFRVLDLFSGCSVNVVVNLTVGGLGAIQSDVVQSALNYPNPAASYYSWSMTPVFINTATIEPGRALKDNGGILIQHGQTLQLQLTADATTQGTHTPKFAINLPIHGNLKVKTKVNGVNVSEDFNVLGPLTVPSPTSYTVFPPSFELDIGDTVIIDLIYSHPSGAGGSQSEKALLDYSDMRIGPFAAEAGTLVWSYKQGDISIATFNNFIDPNNVSTSFVYTPAGRIRSQTNANHLLFNGGPQRLLFPINYEMPSMEPDNRIRFWSEQNRADPHCLLGFYGVPSFAHGQFVNPGTRYKVKFEMEFSQDTDWDNVDWMIPVQLHPGSFPSTWTDAPTAPINLYVNGDVGSWLVLISASNQSTPVSFTRQVSYTHRFVPGYHIIEMDFRVDYTGSVGFTKVWIDRYLVADDVGSNAIGKGSLGNDAMFLRSGCYCSTPAGMPDPSKYPEVFLKSFQIREF